MQVSMHKRAGSAHYAVRESTGSAAPSGAQRSDPMHLSRDKLAELEAELSDGNPSAKALCRAADVLLIEDRPNFAASMLRQGLANYTGGADRALLAQRLADALLGVPSYEAASAAAFQAAEVVENIDFLQGVRTIGLAALLDMRIHGAGGRYVWRERMNERLSDASAHGVRFDPRGADIARALQAMHVHFMGRHDEAAGMLAEVREPHNRFMACLWMRELDEAMGLAFAALDRGDAELLSAIWRSPLLKELQEHPRFDAFAVQCGTCELRERATRLNVPERLMGTNPVHVPPSAWPVEFSTATV